jgi:hypothetical protein
LWGRTDRIYRNVFLKEGRRPVVMIVELTVSEEFVDLMKALADGKDCEKELEAYKESIGIVKDN